MFRGLLYLVIAAALAGCVAQAHDATAWRAAHQQIGLLRTGMSTTDVEALGYPVMRDEPLWEGTPTLRLNVSIEDEVVEAWFYEGRVEILVTQSQRFATAEGARVGMTLGELRRTYPNGRVSIGNEEGGYFFFKTAPDGVSFEVDHAGVPDSCYEYQGRCPDLSAQRATAILVRAP